MGICISKHIEMLVLKLDLIHWLPSPFQLLQKWFCEIYSHKSKFIIEFKNCQKNSNYLANYFDFLSHNFFLIISPFYPIIVTQMGLFFFRKSKFFIKFSLTGRNGFPYVNSEDQFKESPGLKPWWKHDHPAVDVGFLFCFCEALHCSSNSFYMWIILNLQKQKTKLDQDSAVMWGCTYSRYRGTCWWLVSKFHMQNQN